MSAELPNYHCQPDSARTTKTLSEVGPPAAGSVPLDLATLKALQPIHDVGDQAIRERDAWNTWSVHIARLLNVSCSDFKSDVVAEQYAELRDRITQALNG